MTRVGEWLSEEGLIPEEDEVKAFLWPKDLRYAKSLLADTNIDNLAASSPDPLHPKFEEWEGAEQASITSHQVAREYDPEFDFEYGGALATDMANSMGSGMSKNQAIEKILDTSGKLLNSGGVAVYSMSYFGQSLDLPQDSDLGCRENQMVYARDFEDIVREDPGKEVIEIYEEPDFERAAVNFAWKNYE